MSTFEKQNRPTEREGLQDGRTDAQISVLLRQLEYRFGCLPNEVIERVRGANDAELETWCERVLNAVRLEDVVPPDRGESAHVEARTDSVVEPIQIDWDRLRAMDESEMNELEKMVWRVWQREYLDGLTATLIRMLVGGFGPLSRELIARVRRSTEAEVRAWTERSLDADSLGEIFAE